MELDERMVVMAFYDSNGADGSGFDPAPWGQRPAASEPAAAPEPEPVAAPGPARAKARPRGARPAFAWTADRVRRVRDALDGLKDERTRGVVAAISDADAADTDRLALALLKGGLAGPVGLVLAWHDETDPLRRAIGIGSMLEKDAGLVRRAARVMLVLDPGLEGTVRPSGSNATDLQYALASAAPDLDVSPIRGLA